MELARTRALDNDLLTELIDAQRTPTLEGKVFHVRLGFGREGPVPTNQPHEAHRLGRRENDYAGAGRRPGGRFSLGAVEEEGVPVVVATHSRFDGVAKAVLVDAHRFVAGRPGRIGRWLALAHRSPPSGDE